MGRAPPSRAGSACRSGSRRARATSAPACACRAVKAAELQDDDLAEALLRALRFGYFATPLLMDTEEAIRTQAATVAGLDVDRLLADLKSAGRRGGLPGRPGRDAERRRDRPPDDPPGQARQHRRRRRASPRRACCSSATGSRLVAGGWQSFAVYDVMVANLAPELERRETPEPGDLLPHFPHGLTTQEVAVACTANLRRPTARGRCASWSALAADGQSAPCRCRRRRALDPRLS